MDRIQGTDGIRREVRRQDDPSLAGLSPGEAFVGRGVITEAFLEGYAYAYARGLAGGGEVVVAWDPRDPEGVFTGAAIRGLRKAGKTAVVMGAAPTPAVPMYMVRRGASAGLMITASHNPAGQNGVKIFLAPAGLKLLPEDDRRLTAAVGALDWGEVAAVEVTGEEIDAARAWREVFERFHLAEGNAWLAAEESPLADFVLVVDPARGSYSGVAAAALRTFGAEVYEVNADEGDGRVNWRSGVADLEGVASFGADDVAPGGRFEGYPAVAKLVGVAAGRGGEAVLAGAIFDADGDRFFLAVYDPGAKKFWVLSGDEVAILQAEELARRLGGRVNGRAFVNTVESDLAVAGAAAALGFTPDLKPVGDKWILTEAWRRASGIAAPSGSGEAFSARLEARFGADGGLPRAAEVPYGVGCEETGHAITFGDLERGDGTAVPFAAGNGLKSALNTLASLVTLKRGLPAPDLYARLREPFPRGYKSNNYVFFSDKQKLLRGGAGYDFMDREIEKALRRHTPALRLEKLHFGEEPDLLYWAGFEGDRQVCGVFCRNSGTEDKSALYVRAEKTWSEASAALEEDLYPKFYAAVKDFEDPRARAEAAWLAGAPPPAGEELRSAAETFERLARAGRLTRRGEAVVAELKRAKKL